MSKKFIMTIVFAGIGIVILSGVFRGFVSKRSARLPDRVDEENKQSFLSLANSYEGEKDYLKAKSALKELVERFPVSGDAKKARKNIEKLNIRILLSDIITPDSIAYQIQPGDTLSAIASRFGTTVELLKRANNLSGDVIRPGKFLKVNKAKFSIVVDRGRNTLTLKKAVGETLKTYTVSTGKDFATPIGTFTIEEKLVSPVWYKVGAVVEPDSPEYELGSRWMGLSADGYGIHGTNDAGSIGGYITKGCVRMRNEDIEELYAIVPPGTEVTITE